MSALIGGTIVGSLYYNAQVLHKGNVPSPNVSNHLEYQVKPEEGKRTVQTLRVTPGHLQVRGGHWDVRNNERNWSIMAQDMQKQKDDFGYRSERSRDDDFGRMSEGRGGAQDVPGYKPA
jgi:hypothetical protein